MFLKNLFIGMKYIISSLRKHSPIGGMRSENRSAIPLMLRFLELTANLRSQSFPQTFRTFYLSANVLTQLKSLRRKQSINKSIPDRENKTELGFILSILFSCFLFLFSRRDT